MSYVDNEKKKQDYAAHSSEGQDNGQLDDKNNYPEHETHFNDARRLIESLWNLMHGKYNLRLLWTRNMSTGNSRHICARTCRRSRLRPYVSKKHLICKAPNLFHHRIDAISRVPRIHPKSRVVFFNGSVGSYLCFNL
ncbi:hypothetical protein O6P43_018625 [Quillaja saponaria]|uniref:Uncharacterized protein n=1 Tax=Quillaja saponaria TaxID=32244 RepID=A0AAD7LIN6_QUISA|nr:hypothetical protein O6P43_018625 [Quillaja saponaria]